MATGRKQGGGRSERGVAFLEFILVAALFLTLVLTFFDLCHYFTVRMLLLRAAQQTLAIATKYEKFQSDFSTAATLSSTAPEEYVDYLEARQALEAIAASIPSSSLISQPGTNGVTTLTTFTAFDESAGSRILTNGLVAAIIRPGESWYSDLQQRYINHPGVCSAETVTGCSSPRASTDTMDQMLHSFPIVVVMQARKRSLIPFWQEVPVSASAVGWVQLYPKTPFEGSDFAPTRDDGGSTPPTCTVDTSCPNWDNANCRCCAPRTCPSGEHWDVDMCDCTDCPVSSTYCPGRFQPWNCWCQCPDGYGCPPSDPGQYECTNCIQTGGGSVGS